MTGMGSSARDLADAAGPFRSGLTRVAVDSERSVFIRKGGLMALSPVSRDSVLSIASNGSVLSIGSTGSVLSIGSIGSLGSAFSVGSAGSIGSIFSAGSIASVFSAGGNGHMLGKRAKWREAGTVAGTLAAAALAIVIRRAVE